MSGLVDIQVMVLSGLVDVQAADTGCLLIQAAYCSSGCFCKTLHTTPHHQGSNYATVAVAHQDIQHAVLTPAALCWPLTQRRPTGDAEHPQQFRTQHRPNHCPPQAHPSDSASRAPRAAARQPPRLTAGGSHGVHAAARRVRACRRDPLGPREVLCETKTRSRGMSL